AARAHAGGGGARAPPPRGGGGEGGGRHATRLMRASSPPPQPSPASEGGSRPSLPLVLTSISNPVWSISAPEQRRQLFLQLGLDRLRGPQDRARLQEIERAEGADPRPHDEVG